MGDLASEMPARSDGEVRAFLRTCPECGADLIHANGCVLCSQCGYSPCD